MLNNHTEIAHRLIKTGSGLMHLKYGLTPLHCGAQMGTTGILLKSFEVYFCISDIANYGETAPRIAVRCNNIDVFKILRNDLGN